MSESKSEPVEYVIQNEGWPVPVSVTRADLNEALRPLMKLLGITPGHIYHNPPLMIGDAITFACVATSTEEWFKEPGPDGVALPDATPVGSTLKAPPMLDAPARIAFHPQNDLFSELAIPIKVEIVG